jgi:hypothetical protein
MFLIAAFVSLMVFTVVLSFLRRRAHKMTDARTLTPEAIRAYVDTLPTDTQVDELIRLGTEPGAMTALRDTLNPPTDAERRAFRAMNIADHVGLFTFFGLALLYIITGI